MHLHLVVTLLILLLIQFYKRKIPTGFSITDELNIGVTGIATVAGKSFAGIKTDTIIRYQLPDEATERFNRVVEGRFNWIKNNFSCYK